MTDDAGYRETFGCELNSDTRRLLRLHRKRVNRVYMGEGGKNGGGDGDGGGDGGGGTTDAAQSSLIRVAAAVAAGY